MARNDTNKKVDPEATPNGNTALMPAMAEDAERALADELLARAREQGIDLVGPDGLLTKVTKNVLEAALGAELTDHLGHDAHDPTGRGTGNSRNGTTRRSSTPTSGP
jgi:putative transposase